MRLPLLLLLLLLVPAAARGGSTDPVRLTLTPERIVCTGGDTIDLARVTCLVWRGDGSWFPASPRWNLLEGEGALDGTTFLAPTTWRRGEGIFLDASVDTLGVSLRRSLRIRVYPERPPDRERGCPLATLGGTVDSASPVARPDGSIIVPDGPGGLRLRAFGSGGTPLFATETGGSPCGTPALGRSGEIYVGTTTPRQLVALDERGAILWRAAPHRDDDLPRDSAGSPAVGPDGTVAIGFGSAGVHAYASDGRLLWIFESGSRMDASTPAFGPDGTLFAGSYDGHLYAIAPGGILKWKFETERWMGASRPVEAPPLVLPDGSVVFGDDGGVVRRVSPDGRLLWLTRTEGYVRARALLAAPDLLVVPSYDGTLHGLAVADGSRRFGSATLSMPRGGAALLSDGTIAAGDGAGILRIFDRQGKELNRYAADDEIRSTPCALPNGGAAFTSTDGRLHLVRGGTAATPEFDWSKFK